MVHLAKKRHHYSAVALFGTLPRRQFGSTVLFILEAADRRFIVQRKRDNVARGDRALPPPKLLTSTVETA
jgi:hypothetical protein